MVNEINFTFYKDLKGIEIILVPCDVIILNKLNKTVKTDIFIDVISRNIHSITMICFILSFARVSDISVNGLAHSQLMYILLRVITHI